MKALAIVAISASMMWAAININTASKNELMELPGIGKSKAEAIISYRQKSKFNSIDEIKNVSGIGDKIYENIKIDLITSGATDTTNLKSLNKENKKPTKKDNNNKVNKDNNLTKK
jgi:competence protein ComEA